MKRIVLILGLFLGCVAGSAQVRIAERTYVTTDRDWYAAGEPVFLSAFCVDVSDGVKLSDFSSIAYLELRSADGVEVNGKVALFRGRGAGRLDLPRSLPTGNYRLSAYTASARNEVGYDCLACSKVISVYNTLSTARVADGVEIGPLPAETPWPEDGPVRADFLSDGRVRLSTPDDATVSVSIFRKEGFPSYGRVTAGSMLATPPSSFVDTVIPEYDGEIVTLRLTDPSGGPLHVEGRPEVFISRPGHPGDIYASDLQADGTVRFFTNNLFGEGDLVVSLRKDAPPFQVEVVSPFIGVGTEGIPPLRLDPALAEQVTRLGARMQVTSAFEADTLYGKLPVRELPFFGEDVIRYVLDDYTRFATMREVFIEYLSEIRARRRNGVVELQVRCQDAFNSAALFAEEPSLILVDGVPVMDHSLVYELDPALVKEIEVYPYHYAPYYVYGGIANFITFKGDLSGIRFGGNVRILDFTGTSWPQSFQPDGDPRYPLVRETLLWQPLLELDAGQDVFLPLPEAEEGVVIVVEGITAGGEPVYYRKSS